MNNHGTVSRYLSFELNDTKSTDNFLEFLEDQQVFRNSEQIFFTTHLSKSFITYLDLLFMQSQTKAITLTVYNNYRPTLLTKNMSADRNKSHIFLAQVNF